MKLKAIFWLFNAVLFVSFLLIFLMPLFLLGTDYFSLFWARNWIIAVVFIASLAALNSYFIVNWRLFRLLEREDWPALVSHLEDRILAKGKARATYIRMIVNAYLITSNTDGILALEAYLKEKKPALIPRFSLQFGIPYLLMKDPVVSETFFSSLLKEKKTAARDWMGWNRSFCLLQQNRHDEAKIELTGIFMRAKDPLLRMVSLYLLDVCARTDPEVARLLGESREMLKHSVPERTMRGKMARSGDNMEVVVLARIVQDACEWLYAEEGTVH
jgi:hypothetical protein